MRNVPLSGFVLHKRAFRENSQLVQFFSLELGRVDGVARKALTTLYQPTTLFATGRNQLRSFTQLEAAGLPLQLAGDALFAGFYVNELLARLLPSEEPQPATFAAYSRLMDHLSRISTANSGSQWVDALRRFELVLLKELGYEVRFDHDRLGLAIKPEQYYRYRPDEGFEASPQGESGAVLQQLALVLDDERPLSDEQRLALTRLNKLLINRLLGDKPLKSRELWQKRS